AEFGTAFAQQRFQRLHGRGGAARSKGGAGRAARRVLRDIAFRRRRAGIVIEAERLRQVGVELAQRRRAAVGGLRRLAKSLRRQLARAVRGGEVGAALEGIIGRRLKPGLRAGSGGSLADAGVEQVGERRVGRRLLRPRRFGAGGPGGVLLRMLGRIARALRRGRL